MAQLILQTSSMHIYFVLARRVETLHKTKSTVFISLLLMSKGGPRGKKGQRKFGLPQLFLSFYVVIFREGGWLIQGKNTSEKGYGKIFGSLLFFRKSLPFLKNLNQTFFYMGKHDISRLFTLLLITHLPCTSLESHQAWMHCGSMRILCSQGIANAKHEWSSKEWQTHMHLLSGARSIALCGFTCTHKFKCKIIKNFRMVITEC